MAIQGRRISTNKAKGDLPAPPPKSRTAQSSQPGQTGVISARPDSAEAFNNRGIGHYNAGRYPEAVSDYDRAIRLKDNYAVAFNNRGNTRYATANYQEALADYSASLRIDPQYANAYSNRGLAYIHLDQQPRACSDFQTACELGSCETLKWAVSQQICK